MPSGGPPSLVLGWSVVLGEERRGWHTQGQREYHQFFQFHIYPVLRWFRLLHSCSYVKSAIS
jgi:hypothetical protein